MLGFDIQIHRVEDKETLVFHYENFDVRWLDELVKEKKLRPGHPMAIQLNLKYPSKTR
jgi:hypothetical protein